MYPLLDFPTQWDLSYASKRRDRLTSWKTLKELKDSHRVETAEYAVAQEIDHKSSFNWWVKAVLKKHLRII